MIPIEIPVDNILHKNVYLSRNVKKNPRNVDMHHLQSSPRILSLQI